MTSDPAIPGGAPGVSIAVFAWNEERALRATLESLFEQSLFRYLSQSNSSCEVVCVANGCTDRTAEVAVKLFQELIEKHPHRDAIRTRVTNILERGKINAWNQYVHEISAASAKILFMMDADILIHRRETMENMLKTLEGDDEATVAVDVPRKHIAHKKKRSIADRLSLAASHMTLAADGQLCGQLYCIRSDAARRIYLPKDLSACEDGLIKTFVCTDFLSHPSWPKRIRVAPDAEHTFEAYTTLSSILKNQKRQIIGQTIVHVLVDKYLQTRRDINWESLATFLKTKDAEDPSWLKRLIAQHLQNTLCFWRLYPDLVGNRFRRLRPLPMMQRLACLPAAVAGCCATLMAAFLAYRSLKRGCINYWPKAERAGLARAPEAPDSPQIARVSLSRVGTVK